MVAQNLLSHHFTPVWNSVNHINLSFTLHGRIQTQSKIINSCVEITLLLGLSYLRREKRCHKFEGYAIYIFPSRWNDNKDSNSLTLFGHRIWVIWVHHDKCEIDRLLYMHMKLNITKTISALLWYFIIFGGINILLYLGKKRWHRGGLVSTSASQF